MTAAAVPPELREGAGARVGPCLELLEALVTFESPSADPESIAPVAALLREALERRGAMVERHDAPGYGAHLVARLPGHTTGGPPLLVLGHMDTVHALGTLRHLPFEIARDRVRGPGVYDMKGGLAVALAALDLLAGSGRRPARDVAFLITCDEEVGSPTSRALVERMAGEARGALVLEPSAPGGAAKTRRKGVGAFEIGVRGRAAHAGIEPEAGASAVHEMIRLLAEVRGLGDPERGTTINVGVMRGGTRGNVVAERAEAEVDFRFWTRAEADRVVAAVRALRSGDERCALEIAGGINRGALERTEASTQLFVAAREIAAAQGWTLHEAGTGGASDGNLASAAGCPTLDGLGPDGGGAHSLDEHVKLADIAPRIALLAGLFLRL